MSSQVITTLPGTEPTTKNSESPVSSETEIEPGKQKNFYRHVSGAGDGLPSQTTADFGPKSNSHIVKMENGSTEQTPDIGQPVPISEDLIPTQQEKTLDTDWQKKIRNLQDQVNKKSIKR